MKFVQQAQVKIMDLLHGFLSNEKFYDDVNFPVGFRKSGDFTIIEAELLTNIGKRLFNLEHGLQMPANQVEEKFVFMCKSHKQPDTKVEILWKKYKALTSKSLYSLHGSCKVSYPSQFNSAP